jgi:hypothetical protein
MTKSSEATASIEDSDDDGRVLNENDEVDSSSSESEDNRDIVHAAAASTICNQTCRAGKEPITIQPQTRSHPKASTSAQPTAIQASSTAQAEARTSAHPSAIQAPTTVQPEASSCAHPTSMQSVIMPPSTSLRLLASIAEESSPKIPSRVQLEVSSSASPPAMHSQIVIPSRSDFDTSEGYDDQGDFVSESRVDCTQLVDDRVRQSAARLASSLSVMRQVKGLPC